MTSAWCIEFQGEVDSTNLRAAERVLSHWQKNEPAHGFVFLAGSQTAGRGQHGRTWASPVGGLYLSVVLEDFPPTWRDRLALVAGLAVVNALETAVHASCGVHASACRGVHASACSNDETNSDPQGTLKRELRANIPPRELFPLQIRWPNDILLHGKKLAGILCEALSQGDRFAAIIGIGINVHTPLADLPPDVRPLATTLASHGITCVLPDLAHSILHAFSALLLEAPTLPHVVHRLQPRDALFKQSLFFDDGQHVFPATGAGIQDDGSLLLSLPDGTRRPYARGRIVPPPSIPTTVTPDGA